MTYKTSFLCTGKTVYIKNEITQTLDKAQYRTIMMTFSAQTNANQTQVGPESTFTVTDFYIHSEFEKQTFLRIDF